MLTELRKRLQRLLQGILGDLMICSASRHFQRGMEQSISSIPLVLLRTSGRTIVDRQLADVFRLVFVSRPRISE
jgi:hypothetical protein